MILIDRKRKGGGTCVYISTQFVSADLDFDAKSGKFEITWKRIVVIPKQSFILCALYHPPKTSHTPYTVNDLLEEIGRVLENVLRVTPTIILSLPVI